LTPALETGSNAAHSSSVTCRACMNWNPAATAIVTLGRMIQHWLRPVRSAAKLTIGAAGDLTRSRAELLAENALRWERRSSGHPRTESHAVGAALHRHRQSSHQLDGGAGAPDHGRSIRHVGSARRHHGAIAMSGSAARARRPAMPAIPRSPTWRGCAVDQHRCPSAPRRDRRAAATVWCERHSPAACPRRRFS